VSPPTHPPAHAPARPSHPGAAGARRAPAGPGAIPRTPLVAAGAFGAGLDAARVAEAIARGLRAGGMPAADVCPLDIAGRDGAQSAQDRRELLERLQALGFEERMRRARALIVAERHLQEPTLERSAAFELATRARQAGVPAYAITRENRLNCFDARILDLQLILVAATPRALAAAGRKLARLL
jgi:glycerate kinase